MVEKTAETDQLKGKVSLLMTCQKRESRQSQQTISRLEKALQEKDEPAPQLSEQQSIQPILGPAVAKPEQTEAKQVKTTTSCRETSIPFKQGKKTLPFFSPKITTFAMRLF